MYSHHFGLSQDPFSIAPDPRLLFMSERHREALAHLLYGVAGANGKAGGTGGGFVLLTGDIGTGKTTICRCFLEQIPPGCHVAYIFNPKLTVIELLQSVCEEFHITAPASAANAPTLKDYIDALNSFLLQSHAAGQTTVLIIDEAQNLSTEVLEQLRLLTNLETNERKLLQIVLIGQPELQGMLASPALEQLAQRVIARFHLDALTEAESVQYIGHRLDMAGHKGPLPFDRQALRRIHRHTRGVPRRINLLCGRALLGAWANGLHQVNRAMVDKAATEVFGLEAGAGVAAGPRRTAYALGGVALLAGAGLAGFMLLNGARQAGLAPSATAPAQSQAGAAAVPAAPAARTGAAMTGAATASAPGSARAAGVPAVPAGPGMPASAAPAVPPAPGAPAGATASLAFNVPAVPGASAPALAASAAALTEIDTLLPQLPADINIAWRALAPVWKLAPGEGDPCQAASAQQLQCYRAGSLTMPLLRQLGRPGILTLQPASGPPVHAVLVGLSNQTATLQIGASRYSVRLVALGRLWRGDFATYWRPPPGYAPDVPAGSSGPVIERLAGQLAQLDGLPAPDAGAPPPVLNAALRARVRAFQRAQGLEPDGQPGPMTFMQLDSALGSPESQEPRLQPNTR
ncbi:MAG: Peptidoglycan-binding domain 1 protein [Polaromonas sp.]|nr:Peptidoglycan-binding domain 1 protein [Polaromonas sp.]